jgi:hypothetical protein
MENRQSNLLLKIRMIHPDDIIGSANKNRELSEALRDLHDWASAEIALDPRGHHYWGQIQEWAMGTAAKYGVTMRRRKSSASNANVDLPPRTSPKNKQDASGG